MLRQIRLNFCYVELGGNDGWRGNNGGGSSSAASSSAAAGVFACIYTCLYMIVCTAKGLLLYRVYCVHLYP